MGVVVSTVRGKCRSCTTCCSPRRLSHPGGGPLGVIGIIYEARPDVCREFPNGKKCGYYDFLKFERKHQDDEDFIPSA